ncbi:MAG: hypothetical protein JWL81_1591 [Verrucomicrobiales bacterium]|nr:hypothetical protein [Verrucomicrobiales bacterium]
MSALNRRIVFLDFLRIFAFLSVFGGHKFAPVLEEWMKDESVGGFWKILGHGVMPLINAGGAGVVVFFLVSGYIITHVLKAEAPGSFLLRRVFRIYPLYVFAVLLFHVLALRAGTAVGAGTLLLQLSLLGDFFGTPYALNGVEWTLRVELLFYLFMAGCRSVNLLTSEWWKSAAVYTAVVAGCAVAAPLPAVLSAADTWAKGYITIYGPFLLLGSAWYLFEQKRWSAAGFGGFGVYVVGQYYFLLMRYQEKWVGAHFALIGVGLFAAAWALRGRLRVGALVLLFSDLTYGVYLFHNWLFDDFRLWLAKRAWPLGPPGFQAFVVLLVFCYIMSRTVERGGIRLGRWVQARGRAGGKG